MDLMGEVDENDARLERDRTEMNRTRKPRRFRTLPRLRAEWYRYTIRCLYWLIEKARYAKCHR